MGDGTTTNDSVRLAAAFERDGMTDGVVRLFRQMIYDTGTGHLRSLPWRETRDPYRILVSEVMLQQTQVERVREKYGQFVGLFPDPASLAAASLPEVLAAWQGLGYNRRAKALHAAACLIMERWQGRVPGDQVALRSLPGLGPYTAAAVAVFAFNEPLPLIETNIRAVFIHLFFRDRQGVTDRELLPLVEATLDRTEPRRWFNALMDYGVMLKRAAGNPARRSAHHVRQSPFHGSNRQLRGRLLKCLLEGGSASEGELTARVERPQPEVRKALEQLAGEGFVREDGPCWRLAGS